MAGVICYGQEASFKNFNEQNGLPTSEVYEVFQDRKGFIWFSTDNGVVRFDGGEFKVFNKSNGLADAVVFSTIEDIEGNLRFRTFSGATSIYKDGEMTPYKFNDTITSYIASQKFNIVAIDSIGQAYLANSPSGLIRITSTGRSEPINMIPAVINIHRAGKKNYFISMLGQSGAGVRGVSFNGKMYNISLPLPDGVNQYYCKVWRNEMYLSVNNYLFKLEGSTAKLVYVAQDLIISLSVDNENNFWVGLLGEGVIRFSDNTTYRPWQLSSFKNRSITSVLQDKDGGLWFSTLEKGVYYIPDLKILNYNLPEDSKANFALTNNENVFVGFYNGTMICLDRKKRKKRWSIDLHRPIVSGVFLKDDSLLWISTSNYSVLLNDQGRVVKKFPYDKLNSTKFISKRYYKTQDRIWGVNGYGVLEYDLKSNLIAVHSLGFWCRSILVDGNDIYLPGITGLHKTDRSFQKITEISALSNDKISGLLILPGKRILVTTVGSGFKIINGEKIKAYSKKEGLIFESIYAAAVDSSLWLATEKGLHKVDLRLLLHKSEFSYDLLDKASGLISDKVNFISRNGNETWCISNEVFSVFDDREIHFACKSPVPRLNKVTVNSNQVDPMQLRDLNYQDNNIGFDFGFQSYNNRNLFLRHRSSASNKWNYTRDFNINYYSLAPGKYQFDVEFSTDHMHWNKINFPNVIKIRAMWWETIYFRLTLLLVMGLIFFIYFRAKYKSRLLKLELADQLKSEKERIAQDLHDNIGSRLVSLSLGFNHVVKEYDIEPKTADQIYSNVNSTVSELRDTIWAIQKEGVTVAEFCDKLKNLIWRLRQNNGSVHYDLQIKTEHENLILKPAQAINLYRIVQEAIANSQKHSETDTLSVNVYEEKTTHRLCIKIEDNGKGFVINNSQLNEHYGLRNMRTRALEIKASFKISSEIDDGTRVMISLPLPDQG